MYLSTLCSYVEVVGGKLELVVKLPHRPALHLEHLDDALIEKTQPAPKPRVRHRAVAS